MIQPAVMQGTETHIVHSDIMDFDFQIFIHRPLVEVPGPLPVVYSMDANFSFGFTTDMNNMLLMGAEMPPVLTVGIGYPNGDITYVTNRRMYDLSPTVDPFQVGELSESNLTAGTSVSAGGGPLFIQFLRDELWPWISSNFHVTDDRTYVGDSMGGLFGTYVLFNHPGFFKRYVLGSPWICWDHPICFDYEAEYASNYSDLDAVVFLASGGAEHVMSPGFDPNAMEIFDRANTEAHTVKMGELLASRDYPNLRLKTLIFPEETHFTVPYALVPHGLRYVFQAG